MQAKSDLFLSEVDVDELTGVRRGRTDRISAVEVKVTKFELQVRQLRTMGLPFYVNARGRPVVTRAALEGRKAEEPARAAWQPRAMLMG